MRVADFDYALPEALIAQHPVAQRRASRMLYLDGTRGALEDLAFADLMQHIDFRDVLVLNDTRVVKARLAAKKSTGGKLEVFIERPAGTHEAFALIRANHPIRDGGAISIGDAVSATVLGREGDLYRLRFSEPLEVVLEYHGAVPLPPYITHVPTAEDLERYQTVYAERPGAVAAPTAGLHFDTAMLDALAGRGVKIARVTLHVGPGTFQPVRVDNIAEHRMHSERYNVPQTTVDAIATARAAGGRVLAVGTTALRALESAARGGELRASGGDTDLFVTPGFRFRVVDRLLTNFHLPKSTLLMLVSAFGGVDNLRKAYAHAIAARYRFFSYGDAMLIERAA
ncbi:MAG: tRNA preQ1(34) S-adenosylmethionine ribosyltransferase-isomerase QueA [Betaproteobacteria bacterium]|nr:tRNA preQ1(34) S-adenosylmethionine ribosyltransferase-isomerase QueA [Betaproteobacteria bacterium]